MYKTVITNKQQVRTIMNEELGNIVFDKMMVDFSGEYQTLTITENEDENLLFVENIYRDDELLYIDTDILILDEDLPEDIYAFYKNKTSYESLISVNLNFMKKEIL